MSFSRNTCITKQHWSSECVLHRVLSPQQGVCEGLEQKQKVQTNKYNREVYFNYWDETAEFGICCTITHIFLKGPYVASYANKY